MEETQRCSCCIIAPSSFDHLPRRRSDAEVVRAIIKAEIYSLVAQGVTSYRSDLSYGLNLLAGLGVLAAQEDDHPEIKLIVHVPYKKLIHKDYNLYLSALEDASEIIYCADEYSPTIYHKNREAMLSQSEIAFFVNPSGTLLRLVKLALDQGKQVIVLIADGETATWVRDVKGLSDMCSGGQRPAP